MASERPGSGSATLLHGRHRSANCLGGERLGADQNQERALGHGCRGHLGAAQDLVVGLDPAIGQPNRDRIGENANSEPNREAPGDVPIGVGLAEKDQIRGLVDDPGGQSGGHRSGRKSVACVEMEHRSSAVLSECRKCPVRAGAEVDGSDLTELTAGRQQLEPDGCRAPRFLLDEDPDGGHLRSPSVARAGRGWPGAIRRRLRSSVRPCARGRR